MKQCCYLQLRDEMYHRADIGKPRMVQGQTLKCDACNSEMICENGISGRLRWGMKKGSE